MNYCQNWEVLKNTCRKRTWSLTNCNLCWRRGRQVGASSGTQARDGCALSTGARPRAPHPPSPALHPRTSLPVWWWVSHFWSEQRSELHWNAVVVWSWLFHPEQELQTWDPMTVCVVFSFLYFLYGIPKFPRVRNDEIPWTYKENYVGDYWNSVQIIWDLWTKLALDLDSLSATYSRIIFGNGNMRTSLRGDY